ncbi:MAG: hypothetical protein HYW88_02150 [Candidatus Sungbacteria bacterium]|nr:hypothetical protein [Candidatus Sungbacteria bacterium]
MNDKQSDIVKRYNELPEDVKQAMMSVASAEIIFEIGHKHGLNIERIGKLAEEAGYIMLGAIAPKEFVTDLVRVLGVSEPKATEIAKDVNTKIFLQIREALKKIHGSRFSEEIAVAKPKTSASAPPPAPATSSLPKAPAPLSAPTAPYSNPPIPPAIPQTAPAAVPANMPQANPLPKNQFPAVPTLRPIAPPQTLKTQPPQVQPPSFTPRPATKPAPQQNITTIPETPAKILPVPAPFLWKIPSFLKPPTPPEPAQKNLPPQNPEQKQERAAPAPPPIRPRPIMPFVPGENSKSFLRAPSEAEKKPLSPSSPAISSSPPIDHPQGTGALEIPKPNLSSSKAPDLDVKKLIQPSQDAPKEAAPPATTFPVQSSKEQPIEARIAEKSPTPPVYKTDPYKEPLE